MKLALLTTVGATALIVTSSQAQLGYQPVKSGGQSDLVNFTQTSQKSAQESAKAIKEVQPMLMVSYNGHLTTKPGALIFSLSNAGQKLLAASEDNVNRLVDSGQFKLNSSLDLVPTSRGYEILANGNWFNVRWWGYEAGVSHNRVEGMNIVAGSGAAAVAGLMKQYGWKLPAAAVAVGVYFLWYAFWVNAEDYLGGNRGVTFTATWPHFYMPLVWYQN